MFNIQKLNFSIEKIKKIHSNKTKKILFLEYEKFFEFRRLSNLELIYSQSHNQDLSVKVKKILYFDWRIDFGNNEKKDLVGVFFSNNEIFFIDLNANEFVYKSTFPFDLSYENVDLLLLPLNHVGFDKINENIDIDISLLSNSKYNTSSEILKHNPFKSDDVYFNINSFSSIDISGIKYIESYFTFQKVLLIDKNVILLHDSEKNEEYLKEESSRSKGKEDCFKRSLPKLLLNGFLCLSSNIPIPSPRKGKNISITNNTTDKCFDSISNIENLYESNSKNLSILEYIIINKKDILIIDNEYNLYIAQSQFENIFIELKFPCPIKSSLLIERLTFTKHVIFQLVSVQSTVLKLINIQLYKLSRVLFDKYSQVNEKEDKDLFSLSFIDLVLKGKITSDMQAFLEIFFEGKTFINTFNTINSIIRNINELIEETLAPGVNSLVYFIDMKDKIQKEILSYDHKNWNDNNTELVDSLIFLLDRITYEIHNLQSNFIILYCYLKNICAERINPNKNLLFNEALEKLNMKIPLLDSNEHLLLIDFVYNKKYFQFGYITNMIIGIGVGCLTKEKANLSCQKSKFELTSDENLKKTRKKKREIEKIVDFYLDLKKIQREKLKKYKNDSQSRYDDDNEREDLVNEYENKKKTEKLNKSQRIYTFMFVLNQIKEDLSKEIKNYIYGISKETVNESKLNFYKGLNINLLKIMTNSTIPIEKQGKSYKNHKIRVELLEKSGNEIIFLFQNDSFLKWIIFCFETDCLGKVSFTFKSFHSKELLNNHLLDYNVNSNGDILCLYDEFAIVYLSSTLESKEIKKYNINMKNYIKEDNHLTQSNDYIFICKNTFYIKDIDNTFIIEIK